MNATQVELTHPYVEYRDGVYRVANSRVSLDSLVYRWREGLSPETIQRECFDTLTLAQVFGALAYYLDHQTDIDEYLKRQAEAEQVMAQQLREQYPEIHQKMDEILKRAQTSTR